MNEVATSTYVLLTDDAGQPTGSDNFEPAVGSVVLVHGLTGTAFQRLRSDGKWHSTRPRTEKPCSWDQMLTRPNLIVIYDAEEN